MRVLLVGTSPPPGGAAAHAFGVLAAGHVADGDVIEIVSADLRSASHVTERLDGFRLAWRLRAASDRFDALVLRLELGLPFAGDERRLQRAAMLATLGYALRGYSEVRIVLDSPVPIPGGLGGRATRDLWSRAAVVVENEDDRTRLLEVPWIDADRISVAPIEDVRTSTVPTSWPAEVALDPRPAVLSVVRARAAGARRLDRATIDLPPLSSTEEVSPFEAESEPPKTDVLKLSVFLVRKVLHRLLAVLRSH